MEIWCAKENERETILLQNRLLLRLPSRVKSAQFESGLGSSFNSYKTWFPKWDVKLKFTTTACFFKSLPTDRWGTAVAHWLRCCATNRKVVVSIPVGVSGFFTDIKYFRSRYGLGVDSASNRYEYQELFPGVKSGRCVRLTTYHHSLPLSRNLRTLTSWNPLGLSKPVMRLIYLLP